MKTEIPNAQQNQEVLQLADLLARLVLVKPGTPVDLKEKSIFTGFLMQNRVAIIGIAVILPIDGGKGAQIVYLDGKEDASFQIPAIDPSSFDTDKWQPLRQGEVRREAANAVRHHAGDENQPDSLRGYAATLQCLARVVDPKALSPLEQSIVSRYIHAGEFAWLCLLWLWTGELADDLMVTDNRSVVLEKLIDTKDNKGPLLLDKLCEHGLEAELRQLYGSLKSGDHCWTRTSTRTQDFEKLGFILTSGDNSTKLSSKACVFTNWLCEAVKVLTSGKNQSSKCPHNTERLEMLLNPSADTAWLSKLRDLAEKLNAACKTPDTAGWTEALNSLLNAFSSQTDRDDFRQTLRTEGFPVYPLVHMTMLLGLESPLDWLAIPLGAMMTGNGSTKKGDYWPQAAAFILALHREPKDVGALVTLLRPILTEIAFAESSAGIQGILRQKEEEVVALASAVAKTASRRFGISCPSKAMEPVYKMVKTAASSPFHVLITGSSGTGKEVLANEIHDLSARTKGPFVPIDLGSLHLDTIESELFGHCAGAFSGAIIDRIGLLEEANGGTVFLDEIHNLDLALQARLLRFLAEGAVRRMGENKPRTVDLRVIAATNVNIEAAIREKKIKDDLYFRLNKISIHIPPLQERHEDLFPLLQYFVKVYAKQLQLQLPKPDELRSLNLRAYAWPGNAREMENWVMGSLAQVAAKQVSTIDLALETELKKLITHKKEAGQPNSLRTSQQTDCVSFRSLTELSELEDPPCDEAVSAIRTALHPKGTTGPATKWKKLKESNALAILVAKLREKNSNLTFESLHERCGVSVPKLSEMEQCGIKLLVKGLTSGGRV